MIWLIGNRGMLGTEIEHLLNRVNLPYTASDMECDITHMVDLTNFTYGKNIEWIINCSAYTAVDKAEDEQETAYRINAEGVRNIAKVAAGIDATLIHVSTDYVFSGEKKKAYTEEDEPDPRTSYGQSKLAGERFVAQQCEKFFILRTAWMYGQNGNNFVKTMLQKFKTEKEISVVVDQLGSPTLAFDLAEAIIKIVKQNNNQYGIYHSVNGGSTNWFHFAQEIYIQVKSLGLIDNEVKLTPVPSDAYKTKAKRPKNSVLNTDKLKNNLGISLRSWQEALNFYLEHEVVHGT